ncbi:protein moonraker isoform X1 [Brienomyrus brachyistius]|uniref:protein moonraker isoform X1 n=1 Tax=Brienomyrus brachyistius TaxID=42636 RepID=UPI0020B199F8|nr:protein moonraker isoform X1 [Brienomyrus brachyistius]
MMLQEGGQTSFREPGRWGTSGSAQSRNGAPIQTQLLFNRSIPACAFNRVTQAGPPPPIVIEKLAPPKQDVGDITSGSLRFSVLSEERLRAAVRLAKRDLRRLHREPAHCASLWRQPEQQAEGCHGPKHQQCLAKPQCHLQDGAASTGKEKAAVLKEKVTQSGTRVLVYTPQKIPLSPGQSPPTRDPGLQSREPQLSREIRRLQKELSTYIQRIEQLFDRGVAVKEEVEPEDARRAETRRQEQAVRSARIIYVLKQQVKEIQEDLEKLCSQKIKHSKKSRAMDRLAAAHRGAVRAIQAFVTQLSDQSESGLPTHYKELGQLIRQLSLCSAKIEARQGSAVPETAIDILQKLEVLDSALSRQEKLVRNSSCPGGHMAPNASRHSGSPPRRPHKPTVPRKARRDRKGPASRLQNGEPPNPVRQQVLKAGLERLIRVGRLGEQQAGQGEEPRAPPRPKGVLLPEKSQSGPSRTGGFQQPTVSSRLKVSQPPQKGGTIPWIPTSPHASPPRRTVRNSLEPRCLFSESPAASGPMGQGVVLEEGATLQEPGLGPNEMRQAQAEALRQALLDRETTRRLRELQRLSAEEAECKRRAEVPSPARQAETVELELTCKPQPPSGAAVQDGGSGGSQGTSLQQLLSERAVGQVATSADLLSDAILDDLLEDTAQVLWAVELGREAEGRLQAPTLESMLIRMEEMERDEEAVRRRFTHVSYSDSRLWEMEQDAASHRVASGSGPKSPEPIRLTKAALKQQPTADILLGRPVETSPLPEPSVTDDPPAETWPSRTGAAAVLFLPPAAQRSLLGYWERHEAYLRLVSHEAVGSFDPWALADSLADELLDEALTEVAGEFQDACEEYAEAMFTSEFLQHG